jgi:hypothetical protein
MNKALQTLIVTAALLTAGAASAGTATINAGVATQTTTADAAQALSDRSTAQESADLAALPEPGTYMQLLAAFLVMGFVVSRRTRRN